MNSTPEEHGDADVASTRREYCSALTLKRGDVISIPGLGSKLIGAINQVSHDRYSIRLDEKFAPSVDVELVVTDGEPRSPERHDGRWPSTH